MRLVPLAFRVRVVVAIAAIACAAGGIIAFACDDLVRAHVEHARDQHARDDAREAAAAAAAFIAADGRLARVPARALAAAVRAGDGELTIIDASGRRLLGSGRTDDGVAAPVVVGGRRVATAVVRPTLALDGLNRGLARGVDGAVHRVNLVLAAIGLIGGLVLAVLLRAGVSRPLRALAAAIDRAESRGSREPITVPDASGDVAAVSAAYNRLLATLTRHEHARREAAASVAHELRTPVSGVVTRLEAMEDGVLPVDADNLAAVRVEADRLRHLVEDVGRLFDAESPRRPLRQEPLALEVLVARRVACRTGECVARRLRVDVDAAPATVVGDATRLEQVVDNLVGNALRYTDDGGAIAVRVRARDGQAVLEVADTGIGIRPADLPRVFEPFFRAERSRARATGGAGLGLAVARELTTAHGGDITVASEPGRGTTVTVSLPLAHTPARAPGRVVRRGLRRAAVPV